MLAAAVEVMVVVVKFIAVLVIVVVVVVVVVLVVIVLVVHSLPGATVDGSVVVCCRGVFALAIQEGTELPRPPQVEDDTLRRDGSIPLAPAPRLPLPPPVLPRIEAVVLFGIECPLIVAALAVDGR